MCTKRSSPHACPIVLDNRNGYLLLLPIYQMDFRHSFSQVLLVLFRRYKAECLLRLVRKQHSKRSVGHDAAADEDAGSGREGAV